MLIHLFDTLQEQFERHGTRKHIGTGLVVVFVATLVLVEMGRQGWLPFPMPTSHYYAIDIAFSFLLMVEVVELVFGLVRSVANALGKQIEIMSLILLRSSFKELMALPEPITWDPENLAPILHIISDAVGALLVFVVVGFYYRAQRHRRITRNAEDLARFVRAKKIIALLLLTIFTGIAIYEVWAWATGRRAPAFFPALYTVLIFADVLIVLISLRYASRYDIVFRNSAFAVTTILIRIALTAPPFYNAGLGLAAAGFALGLTLSYNRFAGAIVQAERVEQRTDGD
ncbi:MAG: hypothetical protein AAGI71_12170 [Bacteroidota bacterium]